jgi:hypothetical protein
LLIEVTSRCAVLSEAECLAGLLQFGKEMVDPVLHSSITSR